MMQVNFQKIFDILKKLFVQDFIRTSTYQKAILDNPVDFSGKVVLDVGAGSGILSFFAQQSGAKRVNFPKIFDNTKKNV